MTHAHDAAAIAAIAQALGLYFDGLYHSDTRRLARVFHSDARYVCASEAPVVNLGMAEYFPIVDARPSPASRGEARRDRIVSIALAGPHTAIARVECAIGAKAFTDLLSFIRADGEWRIIAKVFHFDRIDA
ncbi:nuclear transport factor 2 family protein [Roseomonas sp. CECT 9278]|uniref:nuclear transport factor 2 family protein n=1 Tax=Roseomonas sp. CECT 9278 TaxID=2845823 RepID=UPI001E378BC5|nr:nuclear transport factor 2 family protein [Roseomonas sp. CECT 9278]CAH0255175.1 hypothetical protein ROS9278_03250 [Roseomonas sp. CECT 9278]